MKGGTIVCGVSESWDGRGAAELAGALGARLGLRLVLVHVLDVTPTGLDESLTVRQRRTAAEQLVDSVRLALREVRRIARELRPETLEHLGLVSALTELSRKFADQSGIRVERSFADDLPGLSASLNGHLGLRGMRERSLLVGRALAGKHDHDGGAEVRLEVPAGDT